MASRIAQSALFLSLLLGGCFLVLAAAGAL